MSIICPCGGNAYNRDELTAMKHPNEPDFGAYAGMWFAMMGPESYYCSDEDEVLTAAEVKRAKSTTTKVKRAARTRARQVGQALTTETSLPVWFVLVLIALLVWAVFA